ncbi:hypothetical protein GOC06_12605 [Sinorhizobium meliloti]|nr:hypothetical protein [Sinorhizobium meliloti]
MKEVRAVTTPDGQTHELLPDAVARHRHAFGGGGIHGLLIMPDGSSFVCREASGGGMDAEHLDYRQTIAKIAVENLFSQLAGFGGFGGLGQFGIASGGGIGLYHGGGIVGPGHGPRRNVNPLMFANAPRLHNGLLPGEFPAILQRGEMVIPRSMVKRGGGTMIDNS